MAANARVLLASFRCVLARAKGARVSATIMSADAVAPRCRDLRPGGACYLLLCRLAAGARAGYGARVGLGAGARFRMGQRSPESTAAILPSNLSIVSREIHLYFPRSLPQYPKIL